MALKHIELIIKETNILDALDQATIESTLEVAIQGAANAKSFAPVAQKDGGRLRNSIMWKTKTKNGGIDDSPGVDAPFRVEGVSIKSKEAVVGFNLNYGVYQEFGTRYMKPQPFLRPSMAIAKGSSTTDIIKRTQEETLRGTLKQTKIRETFL